jgi:hypothetical protein
MTKLNMTAIADAIKTLCASLDLWDATIVTLKGLVAGITSRAELREVVVAHVCPLYAGNDAEKPKCTTKPNGQRGTSLVGENGKTAQKRVERILKDVLGVPAKVEIEIDFEEKDVKAMQAVLKRLEGYATLEVDGKAVGAARALALLVAEAKDRI